jgi:hypothetical protein
MAAIRQDRLAYLSAFYDAFYNLDENLGGRISEEVVRDSWNVAAGASPVATLACVPTWLTDFRGDLPKVDVPAMVLHGNADRILPISATGGPHLAEALPGSQLVVVEGAPHGLLWTHAEEVNRALLDFVAGSKSFCGRDPIRRGGREEQRSVGTRSVVPAGARPHPDRVAASPTLPRRRTTPGAVLVSAHNRVSPEHGGAFGNSSPALPLGVGSLRFRASSRRAYPHGSAKSTRRHASRPKTR